ncbi:glutaredoxin family protein [Amycolatopsis anabasis]|uniref:glutaredoxin family protein n=1 Tax=Amycolatopsis anabasis TaxID=1840409 RepID=UPI00131C8443|nr:glutaredoxin family protein [Amycolatopsis anabasis]
MSHQITVMTRRGCGSCEQAERVIERLAAELGVEWSAADVDSDPEWRAEYGDRVPVILLDGDEHSYWTVDEDRLRRDLLRDS